MLGKNGRKKRGKYQTNDTKERDFVILLDKICKYRLFFVILQAWFVRRILKDRKAY